MSKRGLTGQLNMFDLIKSMENLPMGEIEMVSLMPEDEEPEVVQAKTLEQTEPVAQPEPEVQEETEVQGETREQTEKKPRAPRKSAKKAVQETIVTETVEEEKEEKIEKEEEKASYSVDKPSMCRTYETDTGNIEIAYINYNKVRITITGQEPQLYSFESSKDAVDFYVSKMHELEPEEEN